MIQGYSKLNGAHQQMMRNAVGVHAEHVPLYEAYADARANISQQKSQQYTDQQIQKAMDELITYVRVDDKSMNKAASQIRAFFDNVIKSFYK